MLRRRAHRVEEDQPGPDELTAWDRVVVQGDAEELADQVLMHADRVVVESPDSLRETVVRRLRAVGDGAGEVA